MVSHTRCCLRAHMDTERERGEWTFSRGSVAASAGPSAVLPGHRKPLAGETLRVSSDCPSINIMRHLYRSSRDPAEKKGPDVAITFRAKKTRKKSPENKIIRSIDGRLCDQGRASWRAASSRERGNEGGLEVTLPPGALVGRPRSVTVLLVCQRHGATPLTNAANSSSSILRVACISLVASSTVPGQQGEVVAEMGHRQRAVQLLLGPVGPIDRRPRKGRKRFRHGAPIQVPPCGRTELSSNRRKPKAQPHSTRAFTSQAAHSLLRDREAVERITEPTHGRMGLRAKARGDESLVSCRTAYEHYWAFFCKRPFAADSGWSHRV